MPTDPLARVLAAAQAQNAARIELSQAVQAARAEGHSWAELGRLLGMSRQAVFKKFTHQEDDMPTTTPTRPVRQAVAVAESVFAELGSGDLDSLRARMPADVADVLTAQVLSETWQQVVRLTGAPTRTELMAVEQDGDLLDATGDAAGQVVIELTLVCPEGMWRGRVALDGHDRVLGLLIVPPGEGGTAF